jgi:hypothetical protein
MANRIVAKTENPSKRIAAGIALASLVLGQVPWASLSVFGGPRWFSPLYQPYIYRDAVGFVFLVPVLTGLVSTWAVFFVRWGMGIVAGSALIFACIVWYIYDNFPSTDHIHAKNWILSNCVFASIVALVARLVMDAANRQLVDVGSAGSDLPPPGGGQSPARGRPGARDPKVEKTTRRRS